MGGTLIEKLLPVELERRDSSSNASNRATEKGLPIMS